MKSALIYMQDEKMFLLILKEECLINRYSSFRERGLEVFTISEELLNSLKKLLKVRGVNPLKETTETLYQIENCYLAEASNSWLSE